MYFIISILSIYAFVKTIGYAIFEYKDNSNKVGGIIIGILSLIALVRSSYNSFYQMRKLDINQIYCISICLCIINKNIDFSYLLTKKIAV